MKSPWEKGKATHSSILAWRIPWTEEPDRLQTMGLQDSDMIEQLTYKQHPTDPQDLPHWRLAVEEGTPDNQREVFPLSPHSSISSANEKADRRVQRLINS